jgi:hypothetical protein
MRKLLFALALIEPTVIETDLTDEENAMIEESLAEYRVYCLC